MRTLITKQYLLRLPAVFALAVALGLSGNPITGTGNQPAGPVEIGKVAAPEVHRPPEPKPVPWNVELAGICG